MVKTAFKIPIYGHRVVIILTDDFSALRDKYSLEDQVKTAGGMHFVTEDRYFLIFNKDVTLNIMVHECLHCANSILRGIGFSHDTYNDEPACYLLGYIVDKCSAFLAKHIGGNV